MELILASKSPRRCELLRRCGFAFTVQCAAAKELTDFPDLARLPQENARRKAEAVATQFPEALVLGADTMILCNNRAVGKPENLEEAAGFLQMFSGRTHQVITGMALICHERTIADVWSESSDVTFKTLSPEVISAYLRQVPVLDKAGAYAIQEHGDMLVADFSGEIENIIGLPLQQLTRKLRSLLGSIS